MDTYVPVFIIDGVKLIAKVNKSVFVHLIYRAKYLANLSTLRVIFVSSEGSVMPLVNGTSSKTRNAIIEIADISNKEVEMYLAQYVPKIWLRM